MIGQMAIRTNPQRAMTSKHAAQALLEFALIIPLLLLLIMGVLDFGRAYFIKITLTNAAREGAYYLSYNPSDKTNCVGGVCYQGTIQAIQNEAYSIGVDIKPADITITNCCTAGQYVEVNVRQTVQLTIYRIFYGPLVLSSSSRMVVQ